MKQIIMFITMLLPLIASAQLEKGRSFASGQFSFRNLNSPANKTNALGISGTYGYLLSNRWATGIRLGYSRTKETIQLQGGDQVRSSYSGGVFGTRYFPVADKLYFTLSGMIETGRTESAPGLASVPADNWASFSIVPGATYFLTNKIAIDSQIGQASYTLPINGSETKRFEFSSGLSSIRLGISVYFR